MNGFGELHLLRSEIGVNVLGQLARENQHAVQGRAQLVRQRGQEMCLAMFARCASA